MFDALPLSGTAFAEDIADSEWVIDEDVAQEAPDSAPSAGPTEIASAATPAGSAPAATPPTCPRERCIALLRLHGRGPKKP